MEFTEFTEFVEHMGAYVNVVESHGYSTEYINTLIEMEPMPELCELLASRVHTIDKCTDLKAIVIVDGMVPINREKITNMLETFAVWLTLRKYVPGISDVSGISKIPETMNIYNYIPDPVSVDFPDFDEESIVSEPIADEDRELFLVE